LFASELGDEVVSFADPLNERMEALHLEARTDFRLENLTGSGRLRPVGRESRAKSGRLLSSTTEVLSLP
jgi:hypothetical protein